MFIIYMKFLSMFIPTLYILGDIGYYTDSLQSLVNNFSKNVTGINRLILMGDNFYDEGIKEKNDEQWKDYTRVFSKIPYSKITAIIGNHDYYGNPHFQLNSKYFENNEFYFKRTISNIDLYFLDTAPMHEGHCEVDNNIFKKIHCKTARRLQIEQIDWLEKELEKSNRLNRKILVFGHYPLISNGIYYFKLVPIYNLLMPIFEKYKVDAYISGHEHNIQYIKRNISKEYTFHQFIVGSSSETRIDGFKNPFHNNMFDNRENFFLEIKEIGKEIHFKFINIMNEVKYLIVI